MAGKFELYKSGTEFRYRLRAGNNEIILYGEGYTNKSGAENGIQSVKINAPFDSRYERKISVNNQYFFVLKALNGEPIGVSEMYTTASSRDTGIESVKNTAPDAPTVDLT